MAGHGLWMVGKSRGEWEKLVPEQSGMNQETKIATREI